MNRAIFQRGRRGRTPSPCFAWPVSPFQGAPWRNFKRLRQVQRSTLCSVGCSLAAEGGAEGTAGARTVPVREGGPSAQADGGRVERADAHAHRITRIPPRFRQGAPCKGERAMRSMARGFRRPQGGSEGAEGDQTPPERGRWAMRSMARGCAPGARVGLSHCPLNPHSAAPSPVRPRRRLPLDMPCGFGYNKNVETHDGCRSITNHYMRAMLSASEPSEGKIDGSLLFALSEPIDQLHNCPRHGDEACADRDDHIHSMKRHTVYHPPVRRLSRSGCIYFTCPFRRCGMKRQPSLPFHSGFPPVYHTLQCIILSRRRRMSARVRPRRPRRITTLFNKSALCCALTRIQKSAEDSTQCLSCRSDPLTIG